MALIVFGVLLGMTMPFSKYPPGKDAAGHFTLNRNKEKTYDPKTKSLYQAYYGTLYGSALCLVFGFGGLALGTAKLFQKPKK